VNSSLAAYLTFTVILAATPGSTTALVARNTLAGGRVAGLATALGAALGNSTHAAAAGLGLAVLFSRWPPALDFVRVAGGVCLGTLGLVSLARAAGRGRTRVSPVPPGAAASASGPAAAGGFRQGLSVNLLNPTIITFYLAVVPSFMPSGAPRWYFAVLAAIHVAIAFACHSSWALALDPLGRLLRAPRAGQALEGAIGFALILLAIGVARR
jgi:threonine/homoserine/homoserine lactone efflux protein